MTSPLRTSFSTICIQQKLTGTGFFNGSLLGQARYAYVAGPIEFHVAAFQAGTEGNAFDLVLTNPGGTNPIVSVRHPSATRTEVVLSTVAGVITANASDVVAAINADPHRIIAASLVTDGLVVAGGPWLLTGGLDWVLDRGIYRYDTNNLNGGLFFFSAEWPALIEQVSGSIPGPCSVSIDLVNLTPALDVIADEIFPIDTISAIANLAFTLRNLDVRIQPGQALRVMLSAGAVIPVNGIMQVLARYESRGSYL